MIKRSAAEVYSWQNSLCKNGSTPVQNVLQIYSEVAYGIYIYVCMCVCVCVFM